LIPISERSKDEQTFSQSLKGLHITYKKSSFPVI
jgi:hypothetical protein